MSIGTTAALVVGGLGLAGGVASSLIGGSAAKSAANTQSDSAKYATDIQKQEFDQTQANQAPWIQNGQISLQQLMAGLQPGGAFTSTYNNGAGFTPPSQAALPGPFVAPTLAEAQNQPGYKFAQQAGDIGLEHAASTAGGAFTTGTLGQEAQFNQNLATQNYQNVLNNDSQIYQQNFGNTLNANNQAYNQALGSYNTNFNAFNTNQSNLYNRLAGIAGSGQTAVNNLSNAGQAAASNEGNLAVQGANAQAAGTIGQANAINGGINSATSGITNGILLSNLMGANGSGITPPNLLQTPRDNSSLYSIGFDANP